MFAERELAADLKCLIFVLSKAVLQARSSPFHPPDSGWQKFLSMAVNYFANPPPGLDLSESRTASNNAIGIVLFALSLVFVLLRLFTRLRLKRETLGLDDYLMFLGVALNAGNLACCIAGQ